MFTKNPFRPLQQVSLGAMSLALALGGLLVQGARADLGPLEPGGYGWLSLAVQPGNYTLRASTFGNVDIDLYNVDRTQQFNVSVEEVGGYDMMTFSVETAEVRYVRYSMVACYTPWGSCEVDLVVDGPK